MALPWARVGVAVARVLGTAGTGVAVGSGVVVGVGTDGEAVGVGARVGVAMGAGPAVGVGRASHATRATIISVRQITANADVSEFGRCLNNVGRGDPF